MPDFSEALPTTASAAEMLTVGHLKQFAYCSRIFYFMTVLPLHPPSTGLMERGHRLQQEFERLEPRRVLSRYGFEQAQRRFSVSLLAPELNLAGQTDLLLEAEDRVAVVEFKASAAPLAANHRLQLAAYALLAEEACHKPCPLAFALFLDREEIEEIPMDEALRQSVRQTLREMRKLLDTQSFPDPTPVRARCHNCEFRNFCGDVF